MYIWIIPVVAVVLVGIPYYFANKDNRTVTMATASRKSTRRVEVASSDCDIDSMVEEIQLGSLASHSHTPARIKACMQNLETARSGLAARYAQEALGGSEMRHDCDASFQRSWKTVCDVAEAKYGDQILYAALDRLGYLRGSVFPS